MTERPEVYGYALGRVLLDDVRGRAFRLTSDVERRADELASRRAGHELLVGLIKVSPSGNAAPPTHARALAAGILDDVAAAMKRSRDRCREGAANRQAGGASKRQVDEMLDLAEAFTHAEMALLRHAHQLIGQPGTGVPIKPRGPERGDAAPTLWEAG